MDIVRVLKSNVISEMFDTLDNEVLLCLDGGQEISERSCKVLKKAENLKIGISKTLKKIEKLRIMDIDDARQLGLLDLTQGR